MLIEEGARRAMLERIAERLNRGELTTADLEAVGRASQQELAAARAEKAEARLGRGLVRRREGGPPVPELRPIVWQLYLCLVALFIDPERGRRRNDAQQERTVENPTGKGRAQYYPKPLLVIIADLVTGKLGAVVGEITPSKVKGHVQDLLGEAPGLQRKIDELWLDAVRSRALSAPEHPSDRRPRGSGSGGKDTVEPR